MTAAYVHSAQLDDTKLSKLKSLEQDLGTVIVAVEPQVEVAQLSEQQLRRLQAAEQEMGVILLAYKTQ